MTALAWDLLEPADVAAFLLPEGLLDRARDVPWPCRAARLALPPEGRAAIPAPLPAGVVLLEAPVGAAAPRAVAAGPAAALARLADGWPELARLLARLDHAPHRLRFADGGAWDLAEPPRVMAVLNVTPDSFSDGGLHLDLSAALSHAERCLAEGADLLDVGGESTRPGAAPVDAEAETRRVVPIVAALRARFPAARVSVDTRRALVARRALEAGADLVNDVSAGADPGMLPLAAAAGVPVALMHMRGDPATMQRETRYRDLVGEVAAALETAAGRAREAGIADDRILLDPGLGFGKSAEGNELLLRQLGALRSLGYPLLVGASRKSFLGRRTGVSDPAARLAGSLAAAVVAALRGAAVIRVHDVGATREALAVASALRRARGTDGC
ncbi:MAG: dihydropteroate synthase [Acidobacteria bacterium]|jgi:dihydropteroate synthase|nr:dihydropteroate synthase [Acidobacteriota bacterium]